MEERKRCLKSLEEFERRTKPKHTFEVKSGVGTPISEILEIEERESDGIELSALEKETLETFRKKLEFVMPSFNAALGLLSDPETRTPEEYEEEVTNYLEMGSLSRSWTSKGQYPVVSCIEMCVKVRVDDRKQQSALWYTIVLERIAMGVGQSS